MSAVPATDTTPERWASIPGEVMRTDGSGQAGGKFTAVGGGGGGAIVGAGPRGVAVPGTPPPPRSGVGVGGDAVGVGGGTVAVGVMNKATFGVGERCGDTGAGGAFVSAR